MTFISEIFLLTDAAYECKRHNMLVTEGGLNYMHYEEE